MRRFIILFLPILIALLLVAPECSLAADPLGDEARASQKPLIADFGMNLCKQCIKQSEANEKFQSSHGGKVTLRFIHVGKEAETASSYKVMLIPTLLFIDRGGREVFRQVGYMPPEEMAAKARELGFLTEN